MFQYMTRCWSFDSSIISNILKTYSKMKRDIILASQTEKQDNIEHLLYKHLDKRLVEHINLMGVEGYLASLKLWIQE